MKKRFAASIWQEGKWYIAQCLEVDIASQGKTENEAKKNLVEALELYFEEPKATGKSMPKTVALQVNISAA